jgi:hypothetical protein
MAVLRYPKRINLDGATSSEDVDEQARALAKQRLAVLASREPWPPKKTATSAVVPELRERDRAV